MVKRKLKNVFLSASIPLKERDKKYFNTMDIVAIRDSIISLAMVALPKYRLIWGGHPSITPLIYNVLQRLELRVEDHVVLYQSKYFEKYFPAENEKIKNIILTKNTKQRDSSIALMRNKMLKDNEFYAGIFIGGMEGVEDEFELFKKYHSKAKLLPIASTGAASNIIFKKYYSKDPSKRRLLTDYSYLSLFQDYLVERI